MARVNVKACYKFCAIIMQHYRFIDSEKHPILVGKVNREAVERGSAEEV